MGQEIEDIFYSQACPLMTGLPTMTFGLSVIRSRQLLWSCMAWFPLLLSLALSGDLI